MQIGRTLAGAAAGVLVAGAVATGAIASHPRHGAVEGVRVVRLSGLDVYWLKNSVQGDIFEIKGGQIALTKHPNAQVMTLAKRLIADHTKSLNDARRVAHRLGVKLEGSPTPSQQWELDQVSKLSGGAFDTAYSTLEVMDHRQDVTDAQSEIQLGAIPAVESLARQDLPTLLTHLKIAQVAAAASTSAATAGATGSGGTTTTTTPSK